MFNRPSGGPSIGNTYQAHYMHPPYGGNMAPHPGGYAPAYGSPAPAYHGAPAQGYAYPPQYVPSYPAYSPYPAYGYNSGPGWGSAIASGMINGLSFGIGEALGADLMFDALF
jgi:hypothetical protein